MKIHEIERHQTQPEKLEIVLHLDATQAEIGRASCRERV